MNIAPLKTALLAGCCLLATAAAQAAIVEFPTAEVTALTNSYGKGKNFAQVDSTRGAYTLDSFTGSWAAGDTLRWRITAPAGFMFQVAATDSVVTTWNLAQVSFMNSAGSGNQPVGGTLSFENLSGDATVSGTLPFLGQTWSDADMATFSAQGFVTSTNGFTFTGVVFEYVAPTAGSYGTYTPSAIQIEWSAPTGTDIGTLVTIAPVPEPSSALLVVGVLAATSLVRRRRS